MNKHGGKVITEMKANELVTDPSGSVISVKASGPNDQPYTFKAKSFILATGGYGAVRDMFPDKKEHVLFYGLPTETGDGLKMGKKLGAATINMGYATTYPNGVEVQPGRSIDTTGSSGFAVKKSGGIFVDASGKRVVNETAGLGTISQATLKAKDHQLYLVMDANAYKVYVQKSLDDHTFSSPAVIESWKKLYNGGKPAHCEGTIESCSKTMGIDSKGLKEQIAKWNADVAKGKDPDFGRKYLFAIGEGPYHIIEQKARYQTTLGGLKANENMQIVDIKGKPIPNLFGAGCVVGGANGAHPLPTLMNTWALVSGYVAAESAIKNLNK